MKSSRFATIPERRFVLFVPQLEDLLRESREHPPLIKKLCRRPASALDAQFPQAGLIAAGALPAAAALTRRHDRPDDAEGHWLRADPIGVATDLAAVWLDPEASFERGDWVHALRELLAEEGLEWTLTDDGRGYIRLGSVPDVKFVPPWQLAGNSLELCLPTGPDALRWQRLLNESQIILRQHQQQATASARVPGSLWFWGAGKLPPKGRVQARVKKTVASDPLLLALSDWLGVDTVPAGRAARIEPGMLMEWAASAERTAEEILASLQTFVRPAWRRLRRGQIRVFELAGMQTLRRFTVRDAWWLRP
ncbi:MAG TPA: hypothetical protein VK036_01875 [Wenzhouxiangella sp.]|nr:hypothetical protein [Wenzhouxiangella sp.]